MEVWRYSGSESLRILTIKVVTIFEILGKGTRTCGLTNSSKCSPILCVHLDGLERILTHGNAHFYGVPESRFKILMPMKPLYSVNLVSGIFGISWELSRVQKLEPLKTQKWKPLYIIFSIFWKMCDKMLNDHVLLMNLQSTLGYSRSILDSKRVLHAIKMPYLWCFESRSKSVEYYLIRPLR